MNACCWSLLTMPSLFVTIFLILVLVLINITTLVHTAVVVPDPFSPVSLPGMKAKAGEAGLNSETKLPPTGESGEDGQYYDDDPSVTFVTDEDIYEDFGGGLPPSGMSRLQHGHYQVQTESDRLLLFALSQIIYKELETPQEDLLEFEFDLPPPTDLAKILWIDGEAGGFYSVKPKGTLDMETLQTYAMPTLDTIFIRKTYRRQGLASLAVQDLSRTFPQSDIGFSYPISLAMLKVLGKHLEERAEDRPRFWEITGCGREGNCRNLWLILQRQRKKVA